MTAISHESATGMDPRQVEVDQVLTVIHKTNDGDDLSPRDLKLSELVVNYGRAALTEAARARWDQVVREVEGGQYVKPWLHAVEHLTKDHDGYVSWRGRIVEHYSFQDEEREAAASRRLGECCRFLEAQKRPVTSAEVMKAYDEARHGQGLPVRRWCVYWATTAERVFVQVAEIGFEVATDCRGAMEWSRTNRSEEWGLPITSVRSFKVVTREDFASVLEQLQQACSWAMRNVRWSTYSDGRHAGEMTDAVRRSIAEVDLPGEEELMQAYFAGEGVPDLAVCDRPRERA